MESQNKISVKKRSETKMICKNCEHHSKEHISDEKGYYHCNICTQSDSYAFTCIIFEGSVLAKEMRLQK